MIFSLIGFYHLYKKNRSIFYAILIFFVADLYVISSWSCWWYAGGSYSSRSLVPACVLLSLPLGYFIQELKSMNRIAGYAVGMAVLLFITLNLFQTWQFENGILNKERMTKAYYFAIFGRTTVDEKDNKLLLVDRSADVSEPFNNEQDYTEKILYENHFEDEPGNELTRDTNGVCILDGQHPFSSGPDVKYKVLTRYDHAWIRVTVKLFIPAGYRDEWPLLVISFHHRNKTYKYRTLGLDDHTVKYDAWNTLKMDYLTPEVFSKEDNLKVYVWQRGKGKIALDDMVVRVFEPKER
jgi:hypothetical protein